MITTRIWTEADWLAAKADYQALLERSNADPLFMSWEWQTLWWRHLARAGDDKLTVHAAYRSAELVGALVVVSGAVRRRGCRFRSSQVLGNRLLESRGVLSEYLDVVAIRGLEAEVKEACLRSVLTHERCSEFAVTWCGDVAGWLQAISRLRSPWLSYVRVTDRLKSYQADLSGGFEAYVMSLSGNARRSLLNRRRRLTAHGRVTVLREDQEVLTALDCLNRLHAIRWGKPALAETTLLLHKQLIASRSSERHIVISTLRVEERVLSVLYDVRVGRTQYNIQMGFDPNFDPGISVGLIHLGFAMEQAAHDGVETYDFLAGSGRTTNYKERIASRSTDVASIQYLSDPFIATLYRLCDAARTVAEWLAQRRPKV